jgi:hypothetical protein
MVRKAVTQKATHTMNSQEFRQAARTTFALAMDAYYAVSNDDNATMDALVAADAAKTAADAQWIADQHTANTMAQAELDAATAKGCEEVAEVASQDFATMTVEELREYAETVQAEYDADEINGVMGRQVVRDAWARVEQAEAKTTTPQTAAEVIANINTNEAFGIAWGADSEVLSYDETTAAIDAGQGWFDRQGRWVNMARMNKLATK